MSARPATYGGQAVIEGVMIRGRRTVALACRQPDGGIYRYREALDSPLLTSKVARAPFVRGVLVLTESLRYGMRMLMRSADVQLAAEAIVDGGLEDLDRATRDDRALHATDELLALPAEHAPDDDLEPTLLVDRGHAGANARERPRKRPAAPPSAGRSAC